MAAGTSRILRYLLFAFFVSVTYGISFSTKLTASQGVMILYFISSSSIPKPELPGGSNFERWKGKKDKSIASVGTNGAGPPSSGEQISAAETGSSMPTGKLEASSGLSPRAKMNATFVSLTRNSDLWDIADSIRNVEDRFNRNYHYDWVFLNDKPFDETFKKVTTALVSGTARYGLIDREHWSFPDFIDQEKAKAVREDMAERKIIYGDSISYRHMCRFESGFFFRQPLMNEYEWYWRVEPSIKLFCDIGFDPFVFMAENKKKYSFVISLFEYAETIPTIWNSTKKFMKLHPEHVAEGNAVDWLSDDGGESYNHCHFVSYFYVTSLISRLTHVISGPILKLVILTGCARKPTLTSLTSWIKTAVSSTNDGEMHLCIPSPLASY